MEALKQKLEKLLGGQAQGMTATWEKEGTDDVGRLSGFGARIEIVVGDKDWNARPTSRRGSRSRPR